MKYVNPERYMRYFWTVRYLKCSQVFYQLIRRFRRPSLRVYDAPAIRGISKWEHMSFQQAATDDGKVFTFLGKTAILDGDWNAACFSKLWLYNLHYQDSLNARDAEELLDVCKKMIDDWITANPPPSGNGWEPYCLSLRIVNWVKFFCRLDKSELKPAWLSSLASQGAALEQQVELHILANHLFVNAKALVFIGAFLGGDEGSRWLKKGLKLLDTEVTEQFLSDGAHYELSPMYQALLLWDLADLITLQRISDLRELDTRVSRWVNKFTKGWEWLQAMTHPDGDIAFFNDATLDIAPTPDDLRRYANQLGLVLPPEDGNKGICGKLMQASGFAVVGWSEGHRLLADVARVGPDYQPGHAHADTLSCELSLFGQRVLVNSGISQYGEDAERHRQRSTAAHNTVCVDGESSSEVWAGFRVARRARPFGIDFHQLLGEIRLVASHDGYRRLRGKVTHSREWHARTDQLVVEDRLQGNYQNAIAHWHLHPHVLVCQVNDREFALHLPSGEDIGLYVEGGSAVLKDSTWHPGFGLSLPNKKLEITFLDSRLLTRIEWRTA